MADHKSFPPEVLAALRSGNKIEAIKLLRAASKVGLAEAKGMVEALEGHAKPGAKAPSMQVRSPATRLLARGDGLSPGEVPRSSVGAGAILVMVVIAVVVIAYALKSG